MFWKGFAEGIMSPIMGRFAAKASNDMASRADSLNRLKVDARNTSARVEWQYRQHAIERSNQKASEQFFKDKATVERNLDVQNRQAVFAEVERKAGKQAAQGAMVAELAQRGLLGTGLASSINTIQQARLGIMESSAQDQERARKFNQGATLDTLVASAFSQKDLDMPMVKFDLTRVKDTTVRAPSWGKAITHGVVRGLAAYYGGEQGSEIAGQVLNSEKYVRNAQASGQKALDSLYGKGQTQFATPLERVGKMAQAALSAYGQNGMDWNKLGQGILSAQSDNNRMDWGRLFEMGRNAYGNWKVTDKPMPTTKGGYSVPKF